MWPEVIAHADWGMHPRKRQMATARLVSSTGEKPRYKVGSIEPAPEDHLFVSLARAARFGNVLIGFDFPIGLPRAYAKAAGISSFRDFLASDLGSPPWDQFTEVARTVEEISLHRPFYPRVPGGSKREHLTTRLGLDANQLRRRCERRDAETMFWTLGGKQVGKGALTGWVLLADGLRRDEPRLACWPFDGDLETLLDGGKGVVAVETYPRAYYPHIQASSGGWSKRRQSDRLVWIPTLLAWAQSLGVQWDDAVRKRVEEGFSGGANGEDEFDAVVGLLAMVAVVTGAIPSGEPADPDITAVEGWILGRPCYLDVPMPDWFALEFQRPDGQWMDEAFCTPDLFCRNRDGSYLRWDGGSGLWIRATQIDRAGVIDHVDGAGGHHRYRLVPLPSDRYPRLPDPRTATGS